MRIAVGRAGTDAEIADGLALMKQLVEEHGQQPREALRYWCLTVLNLNEYLFLD